VGCGTIMHVASAVTPPDGRDQTKDIVSPGPAARHAPGLSTPTRFGMIEQAQWHEDARSYTTASSSHM